MDVWVKKESLKLGFSAVICFCIYYFVYEINQLLCTYKDSAEYGMKIDLDLL